VVRADDLVARLGGDEFAVLLPGADSTGGALVAEALLKVVREPLMLGGQLISVDASIGIAVVPEHAQDADALLRCADVAMYEAKRSGAGVAVYSAGDDRYRADGGAMLRRAA
jgi:diguanylate cyclase (GGDEF)-like protein